MTYRDDIIEITLADSTVSSLIGDRLYPDRRPDNATEPLVVYRAFVSDTDEESRDHDGAGRTVTRTSFEIWAERSRTAEAIADALEGVWTAYRNMDYDIGRSFKANRISDGYYDQLNLYRVILDFMIEHGEP